MRLKLEFDFVGSFVLFCTLFCATSVLSQVPSVESSQSADRNQLEAQRRLDEASNPPEEWQHQFGSYRSVLIDSQGEPIDSETKWLQRRSELLDQWHEMLGKWPPLIEEPRSEVLLVEENWRPGIRRLTIEFYWTPIEKTRGYLLLPDRPAPMPAVVTVYYEPETALGLGKEDRDFGLQLAQRGFAVLSIGTTEATAAKTYGIYHPSIEQAEVQPLSMLGYAAANAWFVLANRPEVDSNRIGIVGHSFGGKWAMFASCLFDRFACAVWSDPGIVFDETRPSVNYWEPWYLGYHPKPWRKRGVITDENPARGLYNRLREERRDLHELHALMAPRPFLVSGGSEDPPKRWQALNRTREVYALFGEEEHVAMTNRPEHAPNARSNAVIYAFFERYLRP